MAKQEAELPILESVKLDTKIFQVDPQSVDDKILGFAVECLQKGEVVAFPTETVYGLGANALDSSATAKIFVTKGRPSDNPLIVHISSTEMLNELIDPKFIPKEGDLVHKIMAKFWPGPLTILFPKKANVPKNVTAGLDYVAVRMPSHPIAKRLIHLSNLPIAAPSANLSGKPSPTTAKHVAEDLTGRILCLIDGGSTDVGVESTVIDLNRDPPLILRPGGVTLEQLREFVPAIEVYEKKVHGSQLEAQPPTPGLKYRHYSPTAKVILFEHLENGNEIEILESMKSNLIHRLRGELKEGKKCAIIQTHPEIKYELTQEESKTVTVFHLGHFRHPETVAKGLFAALRDLDNEGANVILMEGIAEGHEGLAVMNRIRKASSEIVKCVQL